MAATWTDPVDRADGYVVGATVYNQLLGDTGSLQWLYEQGIPIIKPSTETVSASTTLQSDDDFTFTVAANTDYLVEMTLLLTTPAAADWKFGWTLTGMTWDLLSQTTTSSNASFFTSGAQASGASISPLGAAAASHPWKAWFVIHSGTTGGTLNFQWAQNTSDGGNTSVLKNSYMTYRELGAT